MMKAFRSILPLLLAGLLVAGAGCVDEPRDHRIVPKETVTPSATGISQPGQAIFVGRGVCYNCHGQDATGTRLGPDLTDDAWLHLEPPITPEKIEAQIKAGVLNPVQYPAPMPPMGGTQLTEQELEDVAAYVYGLSQGQ